MTDRAPAAPLHDLVIATLAAQGKTKSWLSQRTGVARSTIDSWATQPRPPQAGTVLAVAKELRIDEADAIKLAGITASGEAIRRGAGVDLSQVEDEDLLAELLRRLKR